MYFIEQQWQNPKKKETYTMFTGWKTKYRRDVNSQNLTSE